jgi:hypothetical protein
MIKLKDIIKEIQGIKQVSIWHIPSNMPTEVHHVLTMIVSHILAKYPYAAQYVMAYEDNGKWMIQHPNGACLTYDENEPDMWTYHDSHGEYYNISGYKLLKMIITKWV